MPDTGKVTLSDPPLAVGALVIHSHGDDAPSEPVASKSVSAMVFGQKNVAELPA